MIIQQCHKTLLNSAHTTHASLYTGLIYVFLQYYYVFYVLSQNLPLIYKVYVGEKYRNALFNYSRELNYSFRHADYLHLIIDVYGSGALRRGAARLRDYPPASDKILPGRFFFASTPNLQFLSISYYLGNGSLVSAGRFLPRVTFDGVGIPGVSLLARSHRRLLFPFVIFTKDIKMVFAVIKYGIIEHAISNLNINF